MSKGQKSYLYVSFLSATALASAGASMASAQEASGGGNADTASSTHLQLEEIVVTAQRRAENLQQVPISISAVTANTAAQMGLTGTMALQIAAPALTFNQTPGGAAAITLRGVTGTGSNGDESPTSVYVDGVYLAGTPGLYFGLNNIDRIEVLKGPQGTLFGRNSVGGSIQIITRTPQHEPQGNVSIGYGSYDTFEAKAYVTGGITSNIAVDLAGYFRNQSKGWGKNVFTGNEVYKAEERAVRSKILWEPGPDTSIVGSLSYSRVELPALQGRGIFKGRLNAAGLSQEDLGGFYNVDETFDGSGNSEQKTASLNVRHDFGPVTFVSITGYEDTRADLLADQDGSRTSFLNVIGGPIITKAFSQELQLLSSKSSWLDWIVGAYYFDATTYVNTLATANPLSNPVTYSTVNTRSPVKSHALFGQVTAEVFPGTKITGGLRYTEDKRSLKGFTGTQAVQVPVALQNRKDNKVTYRLALSQDVSDNVMLFASISTGFKSGLYPLSAPSGPAALPSFLNAYEAGFKADLIDKRLRLNASVFWNDYKDVQVRIRTPDNTGNLFLNATDARAKGIDIDMTFVASENLSFRGGLSYLDSKYGSFANASCFFPNVSNIGNVNTVCDASKNNTIQSPEFVGTLAVTYQKETPIGNFSATVTENHNGGFYFDPQNRIKNPKYNLINFSTEWTALSDRWGIELWARNILKEKYYTAAQPSNRGDLMSVAEPRTYGVTLKANF